MVCRLLRQALRIPLAQYLESRVVDSCRVHLLAPYALQYDSPRPEKSELLILIGDRIILRT